MGILLLIAAVQGSPRTLSVTGITSNQATFSATGSGNEGYFEWGSYQLHYYHWKTLNTSYSGSFSDTQYGAPMLTGQRYYVRACDNTGCGDPVSWVVPPATLPNRTSYGTGFLSVMRSGFNISVVIPAIISPYTDTTPGGAPVVWGLLFFFVFAGYWLKSREIFIPMVLAMAVGGAFWLGTSSMVGVPPEFAHVGQGLFIAGMAGAFVSWFSK